MADENRLPSGCDAGDAKVVGDRAKPGHDTEDWAKPGHDTKDWAEPGHDTKEWAEPCHDTKDRARSPTIPGRLFLDVDHSALSISSTLRSLNFYRALGFRVRDRSLNHGLAQERLDGLSSARVRVSGLRPASDSGPGLELLGYRPPGRDDPSE